jgi:hypothetical protein
MSASHRTGKRTGNAKGRCARQESNLQAGGGPPALIPQLRAGGLMKDWPRKG